MGNCTSGIKKKTTGKSASDDNKPSDDVMYASIDHSNTKASKPRAACDDDCDYAIVNVPAALQPEYESDCSSKEETADDYVLMN